jgi:hypothetical protein
MRQLLILLLLFWPSPLRLLNLVPPFLPKDCFAAAFADQARPLRARERWRALTARTAKRLGRLGRALFLFFKRKSRPKKGEKRNAMEKQRHTTWQELLRDAVATPGRMLEAEPRKPRVSKTKQPNRKRATPSSFARIGLCWRKLREKILILRRFPALTSTRHYAP